MSAPVHAPDVGSHEATTVDDVAALRADVLTGLRATPKTLHAKLLYDERGAMLFDAITRLPAYYLTRAETEILEARAPEIARHIGPGRVLVEYGSGEATKVRTLLEACCELAPPAAYVPVDVSIEQLERVSEELRERFPDLPVIPVAADYTAPFALPRLPNGMPAAGHVALFLGSTIGNFHPREAVAFLRGVAERCGPGGALLLGADLRKDPLLLHAAYNDPEGITATFNRNVLVRLNRELDADFDPLEFRHYAFYDPVRGRVEMHLVSLHAQRVRVAGEFIRFARGESIWTESSYKFGWRELRRLAARSGFRIACRWTDASRRFALLLMERVDGGAR